MAEGDLMMNALSPFHQGELEIQQLAEESDIAQRNGSVISHKILPGAIPFISQQNMLVMSSVDDQGQVWASLLIGNPGFISAPNKTSLRLDTRMMMTYRDDPLWHNIKTIPNVGLLAIELGTRRRYRVNGHIELSEDTKFTITVEQAYPNCPKFIQCRQLKFPQTVMNNQSLLSSKGTALSSEQCLLIEKADSFFVGSANVIEQQTDDMITGSVDSFSCDASHRGGYPGFIEIINGKRLRIPDYQGNGIFNTLGNIQLYPKAGLIFIDFKQGVLLQITGDAKIFWQQDDPNNKTGGTQRFWELDIKAWQQTQLPIDLSWEFFDYSPHNPRTIDNKQPQVDQLTLKISQIKQKSETIKSYRLVAADGEILPVFEAGAHLPIIITLENGEKVERHYSLLSSHHDHRYYDIAVQREEKGRGGSKYIHQQWIENSLITAKSPRNAFPLSPIGKHTILIAGGIGMTPILSMLRFLVEKQASFAIHYTAKTEADLAFKNEVFNLAGEKTHLYFSQGENVNRLDLKSLMSQSQRDSHIFLCGPVRMIEAVRDLGNEFNWQAEHIHFENFGSFQETNHLVFEVELKKSAKTLQIQPTQTILDALLDINMTVPFDCKHGECGLCATTVIEGEVDHRDVYLNQAERKQQMCICVSRAKGKKLILDL